MKVLAYSHTLKLDYQCNEMNDQNHTISYNAFYKDKKYIQINKSQNISGRLCLKIQWNWLKLANSIWYPS